MKKINLTMFVFFVLITFILIIIYFKNKTNNDSFICTAQFFQQSITKEKEHVKLIVNTSTSVFFTDKESGFFSMTGSVELNGMNYNLSRRVYFSIAPKTINSIKKITITSEKLHPVDNTPEEIWNNYITPQKVGSELYAEFKKINDNTLIISSLSFPYLICVIQED